MSALSMSESLNQVFRVPLIDIQSSQSNTGIYPWTIDKNSSTVVYVKNATDEPQQYTLFIRFPGGSYVPGLKKIEAGQTVAYDLRKLRDEQIPDEDGKKIPLDVAQGLLDWSAHSAKNLVSGQMEGRDNYVMLGRSEQADIAKGISSTGTYGCSCQNSYEDSWIEWRMPNGNWSKVSDNPIVIFAGDTVHLRARKIDTDCFKPYGNGFNPRVHTLGKLGKL